MFHELVDVSLTDADLGKDLVQLCVHAWLLLLLLLLTLQLIYRVLVSDFTTFFVVEVVRLVVLPTLMSALVLELLQVDRVVEEVGFFNIVELTAAIQVLHRLLRR